MLVDLRRCIGCHACSVSCKTEHNVALGGFRTRVRYLHQERVAPEATSIAFLPLLCMHCQDAPCMDVCPTKALERGADGHVSVNDDRCVGDKACIAACPYGAIHIDPQTKQADKCDFCSDRTAYGLEPACVTVCPTEALRFGDFDDASDLVTQYAAANNALPFKEKAGTKPSVLYIGHKPWMEDKAKSIQLLPDDEDIIYEQ